MTLADRVYSLLQKATVTLTVGATPVTDWISLSGQESYDSPVPVVEIELPAHDVAMATGQAVVLSAGYSGDEVLKFTGGLYAQSDENPERMRSQVLATGKVESDGKRVHIKARVSGPPTVYPLPAGKFIDFTFDAPLINDLTTMVAAAERELRKTALIPRRPSGKRLSWPVHCVSDLNGAFSSFDIDERDVSGMSLKTAMGQVLDDSGVALYDLDFTDYTLASAAADGTPGAAFARMPGSEVMTEMMKVRGCKMQVRPTGEVWVHVVDEQPAVSPDFIYSTTDQQYARIVDATGEIRVPFNPLLALGMTIQLDIDYLPVNGNFLLWGHRWSIDRDGAWSYLDLRDGPFSGTVQIFPNASFVYTVTGSIIGGGTKAAVTFDATATIDPDGVLTDSDIAWTDNKSPHLISGTGFKKTVILDIADAQDWKVSETATDSDGLTDTYSEIVEVDIIASGVQVPALGVAAGTYSMFSLDGAAHWNDHAESNCTAVGLRVADGVNFGHGLFGFADGHIERTLDGNRTRSTVMAACGSAINDVVWDWRNGNVTWAVTEDCRLFITVDQGLTWVLYDNLRTVLSRASALGNFIGLPFAGGVYVFGATGTGFPLISFDAVVGAHSWVLQIVTGDILTDGAGAANLRCVGTGVSDGGAGEIIILANAGGRANGSIPIYHTSDPPGTSRSWTRATGLTAGLSQGRAAMGNAAFSPTQFFAMFNDRDAWSSADGIAWTKQANVLPSGFVTNSAIWASDVLTGLPTAAGVYYIAAEDSGGTGGVFVSTDEFAGPVAQVRPATGFTLWPAGAKAKRLALGAPLRSVA
jgi:hypothetical protein